MGTAIGKSSRHLVRKFLAIVGVVLIVAIGYGAWSLGLQNDAVRAFTVPSCTNSASQLTQLPVPTDAIKDIVPLGNISPIDHTIPTDHMYIYPSRDTSIVSPGKIWVTEIELSSNEGANVHELPDYDVHFTNCRGADYDFGHVTTLSGKLATTMGHQHNCKVSHSAAGETQTYCRQSTNIVLEPGDALGTLTASPDGNINALDFGLYRSGYHDTGLADAKYYFETDAACPLELFSSAVQSQLYAKVSRTAAPACGQVGQDKIGTIQGAWYAHQDPSQAKQDWNGDLAIVHDNHNPAIGVVAIGGTIIPPGSPQGLKLGFVPTQSGTTNLEPSLTTVGTIYCYQTDAVAGQSVALSDRGDDHILVELDSKTTLKAEVQTGSCPAAPSFSHPTEYYR